MKISILISTYNGENDIRALLESIKQLEKDSYELEVIIRDDSSTDNTVNIVAKEYGWVNLVRGSEGNVGFVKSNNIAFQHATGSVICCVNQDTVLHSRFVVEGMKILNQNRQIVGVNTNMIMPWVMSLGQFRKKSPKELPVYEYQLTPFGFIRYVEVEKNVHQTNFMTGGGFFILRSCISDDGHLFDPLIDMYCEDTELSLRLQRNGGRLKYCPTAIIYHNQLKLRETISRELSKLVHITRNRFILFARIHSPFGFVLRYPMYLIGIILKMSYLGFTFKKRILAYLVSAGIATFFLCFLPYFLYFSFRYSYPTLGTRN